MIPEAIKERFEAFLERKDDVLLALTNTGFEILQVMEKGSWCAILSKKH